MAPRLPVIDRLLGRDGGVVPPSTSLRAPSAPFNRSIGPHRRWGFVSLPLDEVKAVKNAAGATVNDVVMAMCAGALRTWLAERDALPSRPLVAAVPVSVRTEDQPGTLGNRVSSMMAALPTHLDNRPRGCKRRTKRRGPRRRLKLVERISPFNLVISNVPGPNVPLYYAGAELLRPAALRPAGRP